MSNCNDNCGCKDKKGDRQKLKIDQLLEMKSGRRGFLRGALAAGAVAAGLKPKSSQASQLFEKFFQKHYTEMSAAQKASVFARIREEIREDYGVNVTMGDPAPLPDQVHNIYCLSLSRCNGNRKCVDACIKENNLDRSMAYIKVLEMDNGTFNVDRANQHYEGVVPKPGKFYMPVQCNQCDNPPCVKACPIEATWKERDGIVVVDYDWCIGCRYCQAACPYEARHFNWRKPVMPKEEINPDQHYLSNRIRPKGVIEKCTFCLHRTRKGQNPACLDACPTGARKFGNLLDPNSEVAIIFRTKRVFVLKEELNTKPRFFYYFD